MWNDARIGVCGIICLSHSVPKFNKKHSCKKAQMIFFPLSSLAQMQLTPHYCSVKFEADNFEVAFLFRSAIVKTKSFRSIMVLFR